MTTMRVYRTAIACSVCGQIQPRDSRERTCQGTPYFRQGAGEPCQWEVWDGEVEEAGVEIEVELEGGLVGSVRSTRDTPGHGAYYEDVGAYVWVGGRAHPFPLTEEELKRAIRKMDESAWRDEQDYRRGLYD